METAEVLTDTFGRVSEIVTGTVDGLSADDLAWRPGPDANTIAWLVWHLTRVIDDHLAGAFGVDQVWTSQAWSPRFALPFDDDAIGYGQSSTDVAQVRAGAELLVGYSDAVHAWARDLLASVGPDDLDRVVDDRWDPPVTMAVRLVSVLSDALQHAGQAAYVRGLLERR